MVLQENTVSSRSGICLHWDAANGKMILCGNKREAKKRLLSQIRLQKQQTNRQNGRIAGERKMDTISLLEELQIQAKHDSQIRRRLLATRQEEKPVSAFCQVCQELGYPVYEMDLLQAGEEFYASIKRSTNGGGENSPVLEGEDDLYELFFVNLGV